MIDDGMRRGLLAQFSADIPITALVSGAPFYHDAAAHRRLDVVPLEDVATRPPAHLSPHVIIDGLDALPDPAAALRNVRSAASPVRVFALVANAVYASTLGAFVAGERMARSRPLVATDLDALFADTGWHEVERIPLVDRALAAAAIPSTIAVGSVTFTLTSPEVAARLTTAGYFVIADPP
jgi:hypothetical protein